MVLKIFSNFLIIVFAISTVSIGIIYRKELETFYRNFTKDELVSKTLPKGVFSQGQLSQYNGVIFKRFYLAILGIIFDVTKGKKHYGENSSYNYFIGKDGSRAFITGDFKDNSSNKDHVIDLKCDDIFSLLHWKDTFKNKYTYVGLLIGRFYDEYGKPTQYSQLFESRVNECVNEREALKKKEKAYPPCNVEWSAEKGSRVWCTKTSGGVSRSWVGVPRQLYTPGEQRPTCVCINPNVNNAEALLKEYDNCKSTSSSCNVKIE